MSEELFVQCCAPTLAGLKTGSMFSFPYPDRAAMTADVRALNRALASRGICVLPLRYREGRALLYVFRPGCLRRDLQDRSVREILRSEGYPVEKPAACLSRLRQRLSSGEEFPHEVGLFLSYPPEDVRGFIENHAQNCKFTGCWKVYGDEKAARETFEKYRKCTEAYQRSLDAGIPLSRLAVSV